MNRWSQEKMTMYFKDRKLIIKNRLTSEFLKKTLKKKIIYIQINLGIIDILLYTLKATSTKYGS